MLEVGFLAAFGAGVLSFLSPCVLPLVPPYLCFLGGLSMEQLQGAVEGEERAALRRRTLLAALAFVLGFGTVFVGFGATASAIGRLLAEWSLVLGRLAGIVILVLGLHFLGVFRLAFLNRDIRFHPEKPAGLLGAYVVGLAFAFGWTPCVGPVLAGILFLAGAEETVLRGALLLAAYAAGLGLPFLLAALLLDRAVAALRRLRAWIPVFERTTGALLVCTGLLFLTGRLNEISYWLLETFPVLGRIG
ncbi:MAG: cytochrome c biogenesis protein CcdA [Geminicoccaceae bacterium]|nr:cytochrome c biogenesis protein CcdA [Geminicoccaceae bacterium]MCS7268066.1 cytochrome c biogenesis protein CcdA [Geminicoccaceae bacterium]MCX7631354.1 cytochrome c biogenesis protein CcdA [Geminicoccaceae bacterium]MDW8124778.1 cytochrome c biogenesis protein CcdA [Geminicoccaceae bacterium]MDW8342356.1 cytochrome c biogenesis protein CcdA [Geminicoccaceae bacterium]